MPKPERDIRIECKPVETGKKDSPAYSMVSERDILTAGELIKAAFFGRNRIRQRLGERILTYADYKIFVDQAKQTRYGISFVEIDAQRIVFFANPSVHRKLIELEGKQDNPYTSRLLWTERNQRLLQRNPVAADHMGEHTYGRDQHKLFSMLSAMPDFETVVSTAIASIPVDGPLSHQAVFTLIARQFSQIYFQSLFGSGPTIYDETLAANVDATHKLILDLYEEIEDVTGKHGLSLQAFFDPIPEQVQDKNVQDADPLIYSLYRIICKLYGSEVKQQERNNLQQALQICKLLKSNDARVFKVLVDHLAEDPSEPTEKEALNICYNLLSWLDNSLNLINTLVNYVVYIASDQAIDQQDLQTKNVFREHAHELRALATLFMRNVTQDITLKFGDDTFTLHSGDKFLITNSLQHNVFGSMPRKCPSLEFSTRLINAFVKGFFARFSASLSEDKKLDPESQSWFWNKLSTEGLVVRPRACKLEGLPEEVDRKEQIITQELMSQAVKITTLHLAEAQKQYLLSQAMDNGKGCDSKKQMKSLVLYKALTSNSHDALYAAARQNTGNGIRTTGAKCFQERQPITANLRFR